MIPKKIQLVKKNHIELPKENYIKELFHIRSYLIGIQKENDFYKSRIKLLEKLKKKDSEKSKKYDESIKEYKELIEKNVNNYIRELFNYKAIKHWTFNFL